MNVRCSSLLSAFGTGQNNKIEVPYLEKNPGNSLMYSWTLRLKWSIGYFKKLQNDLRKKKPLDCVLRLFFYFNFIGFQPRSMCFSTSFLICSSWAYLLNEWITKINLRWWMKICSQVNAFQLFLHLSPARRQTNYLDLQAPTHDLRLVITQN